MAATLPLALDIATLERVVLRPGPEFTEDDFSEFCQEHSLLRIERNSEGEVIIMAPAASRAVS
jgi:Uma2 family endonuclease